MADMKQVVNCETGESELVPLTKAEQAQRELDIRKTADAQAEREQVERERDVKLDSIARKMGITRAELDDLRA